MTSSEENIFINRTFLLLKASSVLEEPQSCAPTAEARGGPLYFLSPSPYLKARSYRTYHPGVLGAPLSSPPI